MSDLEIWKGFFNQYGIKYTERENPNDNDSFWGSAFILETDQGKGYSGFTFCGVFNLDGSFRDYGVWE